MKNSKGFAGVLVAIIIAIVVLGGGAYLTTRPKNQPPQVPATDEQSNATVNTDATAGWKTYTNAQYGFEVKYPSYLIFLGEVNPVGIPSFRFSFGTGTAFSVSVFNSQHPITESYGTNWQSAGVVTVGGYQARKLTQVVDQYNNTSYAIDTKNFSIDFEDPKFSNVNQETLDQILSTFKFNTASAASFKVTSPTAGATLVEGQSYTITWTDTTSTANSLYQVYLENEKVGSIRIGETTGRSIPWTLPNIFSFMSEDGSPAVERPTDGYRISFTTGTTAQNAKTYYSPVFKIVAASQNTVATEGYISAQKVGIFTIGDPVPNQTLLSQANYSIRETTIFPEGNPQKQFIVSKNGKDLLTFQLSPDISKIWDIGVISSEFKTKEGIGVGSTISDFIKAYPNYKFWYSQEEGEHFVLNTSSNNSSPQFLLDRTGLINPDDNFNYPTYRQAKISDFKTSAKIVSARVYFSP